MKLIVLIFIQLFVILVKRRNTMYKILIIIANAHDFDSILEVKSPYSGELIGEIEVPSISSINQAFENSHYYFENYMKDLPAWRRAEILYKVADLIKQNSEDLAMTIAQEGGKPLKDARVEVNRAVNTVRMSGDIALNLNGEQISMDRSKGSENHIAFTIRKPIGPTLAISAFNHPVNLICHQVATAIAAGNSVIVKPAEKTPISAYKIVQYFYQAGLEQGALNYLPITGTETEKIITRQEIKYISFIGNEQVGWKIKRNANPGVKVMLEHGGTAATVVDKNANLERAIPSIVKGAYYHAGQVCVSTQIVYVHNDIYDKFKNDISIAISKLITGDPTSDETDVGPLIREEVLEKMDIFIKDARDKGTNVLLGGSRMKHQCYEPTLLENINTNMLVYQEEVFGPILSLIEYNDIDDVIKELNSSKYAFQTSIFTQDIDLAMYYARKIEQKACMINENTAFRVDWMPFGGYKASGFGTGGMKYAIEDMTLEELIIIKNQY